MLSVPGPERPDTASESLPAEPFGFVHRLTTSVSNGPTTLPHNTGSYGASLTSPPAFSTISAVFEIDLAHPARDHIVSQREWELLLIMSVPILYS